MKIIFILFLSLSLYITNSYALTMKPPSLLVQMSRQERVNKAAYIFETKMNNQMKLAEIRARKKGEKGTSTNQTQDTYVSSPSETTTYSSSNPTNISGVDMSRVRNTWFGWYNTYRTSLGLGKYTHDVRLDITTHDWNIEFAKGKGQNHHRRNINDAYYDFPKIDAWFIERGINPKVMHRSKHTENVGYGYYSCSNSDCTDELIESIRTTFDFFMNEKGKSYDAHYRSIVNPYFTKMGFDIIVVPSEKRYYITVHYITE